MWRRVCLWNSPRSSMTVKTKSKKTFDCVKHEQNFKKKHSVQVPCSSPQAGGGFGCYPGAVCHRIIGILLWRVHVQLQSRSVVYPLNHWFPTLFWTTTERLLYKTIILPTGLCVRRGQARNETQSSASYIMKYRYIIFIYTSNTINYFTLFFYFIYGMKSWFFKIKQLGTLEIFMWPRF